MKATIDVPDDLYRRVKAKAALQGRAIREVAIELFQRWLEQDASQERPPVAAHEMLKENRGSHHSGIRDLGIEPKHMEGFGRDPMREC